MSEAIPEEWFEEQHRPLVVGWLIVLRVPPRLKKWALWEWTRQNGLAFTKEDVEAVTGLKAGTV